MNQALGCVAQKVGSLRETAASVVLSYGKGTWAHQCSGSKKALASASECVHLFTQAIYVAARGRANAEHCSTPAQAGMRGAGSSIKVTTTSQRRPPHSSFFGFLYLRLVHVMI